MNPIVGLIIAFALIVALTVKKYNVALSIAIGAIALAISYGASVQDFAMLSIRALEDSQTLNLTLQVATIGILAHCMKETGLIDDLIAGLRTMLPSRALLAVIPATMGLMPMPGGALLSAPLIDKEADKLGLTREKKVAVNITFRHIWFYVFPLSSSLILTAGLAGINLYQLILVQLPSFFLSVTLGYVFFLRRSSHNQDPKVKKTYGIVAKGFAPIVTAISLNLAGVALVASVMLGILTALLIKRIRPLKSLRLLWKGIPWTAALSVLSVMVLRYTIEDSRAISLLFDILKGNKVPLVVFATLFPFVIAAVSGLAIAGIGISIPFVLPLFGVGTPALASMIVLSTYLGYYISPLHLCLVLSNQYFNARIHGVYRFWIPYNLMVCGLGMLLDFFLLTR